MLTHIKRTALILFLAAAVIAVLTGLPTARAGTGEVNITLVGDILLDRGVGETISEKGPDYPWLKVRDILDRADIAFGNLECPLTEATAGVMKNRNLIFKSKSENARILKQAGFDVLNLANNHSMDYGFAGLEDTIGALNSNGIIPLGGGENAREAARPAFISKAGLKIGFLGLSAFPPEGYFFSDEKPDIAHFDDKKTAAAIAGAKKQCDFLIVSFHWGKEFDFYPDSAQKAMAHSAIDNGADLVVGHHPHVLQGVEEYRDRLIFYSLGNFVFDRQVPKGTDETVILTVHVTGGHLKKAGIMPVRIYECQPRPASGDDAKYILNRIKLYSGSFGANFGIKGDSAEYLVGNPVK